MLGIPFPNSIFETNLLWYFLKYHMIGGISKSPWWFATKMIVVFSGIGCVTLKWTVFPMMISDLVNIQLRKSTTFLCDWYPIFNPIHCNGWKIRRLNKISRIRRPNSTISRSNVGRKNSTAILWVPGKWLSQKNGLSLPPRFTRRVSRVFYKFCPT